MGPQGGGDDDALPQQQVEMIAEGTPLARARDDGGKCKSPLNANGIGVAIPGPGLSFS